MRIIATLLFLAMTVSLPMSLNVTADEAGIHESTMFAVGSDKALSIGEPLVLTKDETTENAAEEPEEIIYKKIVKANPIDTSKPYLQSAKGTMATSFTATNYQLTDEERDLIERVVMSEIGSGTYNDKIAVVQCIYDRMIHYKKTVKQVLYQKNAFAKPSTKTPTQSVKNAVEDVFTNGKRVTVEPIFYFIATGAVKSSGFHETQKCVYITKAHRYYTSK